MRQSNPKRLTRIDDNHFTYGDYEIALARPKGKKSQWIATITTPKGETWTTEGHGQRVAFVKQVATAIEISEWKPNPCVLEKGDLFAGTYDGFELTRSGYQRSMIDGYPFMTLFEIRDPAPGPGMKTWNDIVGKMVVFEYRGPVQSHTRPLAVIRAVVSPAEARTYGRWGGREEEQFEIESRGGQPFKRKNPSESSWMSDAARRLARGE